MRGSSAERRTLPRGPAFRSAPSPKRMGRCGVGRTPPQAAACPSTRACSVACPPLLVQRHTHTACGRSCSCVQHVRACAWWRTARGLGLMGGRRGLWERRGKRWVLQAKRASREPQVHPGANQGACRSQTPPTHAPTYAHAHTCMHTRMQMWVPLCLVGAPHCGSLGGTKAHVCLHAQAGAGSEGRTPRRKNALVLVLGVHRLDEQGPLWVVASSDGVVPACKQHVRAACA